VAGVPGGRIGVRVPFWVGAVTVLVGAGYWRQAAGILLASTPRKTS
jgi:hypothetical protein